MSRRSVAALLTVGAAIALVRSRGRAQAGANGPVGARLQSWVPPPPAGGLHRLAAVLWASPITLAGLLAGVASGVRPRLTSGVVLFAPAGGPTGAAIRRRGFAATGLGHVVISIGEPSPELLAHELAHVRQAERLGPFMAPVYLTLLAVHGYQRHPMEIAARAAATASPA